MNKKIWKYNHKNAREIRISPMVSRIFYYFWWAVFSFVFLRAYLIWETELSYEQFSETDIFKSEKFSNCFKALSIVEAIKIFSLKILIPTVILAIIFSFLFSINRISNQCVKTRFDDFFDSNSGLKIWCLWIEWSFFKKQSWNKILV